MDRKQLQDFLNKTYLRDASSEDRDELYRAYNAYLKKNSLDNYDDQVAEVKMQEFSEQFFTNKGKSKLVQIRRWGLIAAAAALAFGFVYLSSIISEDSLEHNEQMALEVESDVLRIRNEAVAILPNGEEIILNKEGFNSLEQSDTNGRSGLDAYNEQITLKTPSGAKLNFVLPDGSLVWMNSETTLTYPVTFGSKSRKVQLEGEAYFEVVKKKDNKQTIDFVVSSAKYEVKVLGTKFNVNNYKDELLSKTTLLEGAVEVNTNEVVSRLLPNEQFIQSNTGSQVIRVNAQDYISWKEGVIKLDKKDFPAIARMIERNFNINFDMEELPSGYELNGELLTNVNVDELLKGLGATMGVNFKRLGRNISIE